MKKKHYKKQIEKLNKKIEKLSQSKQRYPVYPVKLTRNFLVKNDLNHLALNEWGFIKVIDGVDYFDELSTTYKDVESALKAATIHNQFLGMALSDIVALYGKHCLTDIIMEQL